MKKLFVLAFVLFAGLGALRLEAQQTWGEGNTSELYYINVPIEKVYPYKLGYVVVYRMGVNSLGRAYIPYSWFRKDSRKAELIQIADGKPQPSMSVFYKEKAFHGVRLYVSKRASHLSWGIIPANVNIDNRFEGVEEIKLGFNDQPQQ
ncbi:MAG: hypothetical protein LBD31_02300 [Treponema sp.]|jgi:hypothetical protein|nr:hypothetical protein [Treponema sp.]